MKLIPVTCAIIEKEGKILCAQRSEHMKHPLQWEFPGGKKEEHENLKNCLQREILEELGIEIEIMEQLPVFTHSYSSTLNIQLFPFRCKIKSEKLSLAEHKQINWLRPEELKSLDWMEADVAIVEYYLENYK